MDFDPTESELALRDGVRAVLKRHAGAGRARDVARGCGYDHELEGELREAGYLGMMRDGEVGALPATLMVEDTASEVGAISIGSLALIAPALGIGDLPGPLSIARAGDDVPVRYASTPGYVLLVEGDDVALHRMEPGNLIESMWGFSFARLALGPLVTVLPGQAPRATAWWRIAVATELVGLIGAALDLTVEHLSSRVQFGRALGSFQALQHRLSVVRVRLEGSRWLTYEGAWAGAPAEAAITAAAYAVGAGRLALRELHQMNGAMGLTDEYDLHLWTTRIGALVAELGGGSAVYMALAATRWT